MDEMIRRAVLDGTLKKVEVQVHDDRGTWYQVVGHVVCERKLRPIAPGGYLGAPDPKLIRQAMREEWFDGDGPLPKGWTVRKRPVR
jgi:hypothetical protein